MPELPEVETVRRGLEPLMVGRVIRQVEVLDERLASPLTLGEVEDQLKGHLVTAVTRRGKYLMFELGKADLVIIHHLRMTGSFSSPTQPEPNHVRMRYFFGEISEGPVVYNDPRRFGTLDLLSAPERDRYLDDKLGPEPLDPSWDYLALMKQLKRRRAPIKAVLLDQRVVAGLGNIYVDEACFLAQVHPATSACLLGEDATKRLVSAIRERLEEAIRLGGSTLRDYHGVEGEVGGMVEQFVAYGRSGLPCRVCGETLQAGRIAGRGTTWCDTCQPRISV